MTYEVTSAEQVAIWDRRGAGPGAYPAEPSAPLVARVRSIPAKMQRALDIGCGHGRHLVLLASLGWRVTGLDWSGAALQHAKQRLEQDGRYGNLVKADYRSLPFDSPEFHLVLACNALHHGRLSDFKRALAEIKRVLYAGGQALINVPSLNNAPLKPDGEWIEAGTLVLASGAESSIPHHFFTEDELRDCAKQFRRLELERVVEDLPEGYRPLHEQHLNEWYWITLTG
jgi:ubiquinone/menaquinone biosynthesis C-methylase UbiE